MNALFRTMLHMQWTIFKEATVHTKVLVTGFPIEKINKKNRVFFLVGLPHITFFIVICVPRVGEMRMQSSTKVTLKQIA